MKGVFKSLKRHIGITFVILCNSTVFAGNSDIALRGEEIKQISQDIAKNYFYISQKIQISSAKKALGRDIALVDRSIKELKVALKSEDEKRIMEFMQFSIEEIKQVAFQEYNTENGGLILDYSETLLEGADTLANHNKNKTETMLDTLEEMDFLIERASKYYIAFRAGYKDAVNIEQAKSAVEEFDTLLKKIEKHDYPDTIKKGPLAMLQKYWPMAKSFYMGIEKNELPTIVFITTKHMKHAIDKIIKYHEKGKKG